MPAQKTEKAPKRKRNRKARTEVSSEESSPESSSGDSGSEANSPPPPSTRRKPRRKDAVGDHLAAAPPSENGEELASSSSPPAQTQPAVKTNDGQAFSQWYLQQATKEFGADLEKLRKATDFRGQRSVEGIVRALGQGVECFGDGGGKTRAALGRWRQQ